MGPINIAGECYYVLFLQRGWTNCAASQIWYTLRTVSNLSYLRMLPPPYRTPFARNARFPSNRRGVTDGYYYGCPWPRTLFLPSRLLGFPVSGGRMLLESLSGRLWQQLRQLIRWYLAASAMCVLGLNLVH